MADRNLQATRPLIGNVPRALARVVARYVRAFAPERIILFGSYANGTSCPASDLDLLVVVNADHTELMHLQRARQLAADCFPPVDVVFATSADVADERELSHLFSMAALECGIILYRATNRVVKVLGRG